MNPNVVSNPKRLWYVAIETTDTSGQALKLLKLYISDMLP